jgi:glycosyltransferase involved in cell wall biosynthesis
MNCSNLNTVGLPLVSVVVTTLNHENYIKGSIESILSQTYKNIEIIVGDDCSSDSTSQILQNFKSESKIKVFNHQNRLGPSGNTNFLLEKCMGEYICLMSGDDLLYPECIQTKINIALSNPDICMVFDANDRIDKFNKLIPHTYFKNLNGHTGKLEDFLINGTYVYILGTLLKSTSVAALRYPDVIAGEFHLLHKILEQDDNNVFVFIKEPLAAWRKLENSMSTLRSAECYFGSLYSELYLYQNHPSFREKILHRILNTLKIIDESLNFNSVIIKVIRKILTKFNGKPLNYSIFLLFYFHKKLLKTIFN